MGAPTTSVPQAHIHSEEFPKYLIYNECTDDKHPSSSHSFRKVSKSLIYSGCTDNKRPSGSHSFRSFPKSLIYSGCTDDKCPLGSHSFRRVSKSLIYNGCTDGKHPLGSHSFRSFPKSLIYSGCTDNMLPWAYIHSRVSESLIHYSRLPGKSLYPIQHFIFNIQIPTYSHTHISKKKKSHIICNHVHEVLQVWSEL